MNKKILILEILSDDKDLLEKDEKIQGTYKSIIAQAMGISEDNFILINAATENIPKDPTQYSGIIIGRSAHNPIDGEETEWMTRVYTFIKEVVKSDVPFLGICGGLQFAARAFGIEVVKNPKGQEFGSFDIKLTEDGLSDPLFEDLPKEFTSQISHNYCVETLKEDWNILAFSDKCKNQAIDIGEKARLVQFHPELTAKHLGNLCKIRNQSVEVIESPLSKKILQNFLKNFILK